MKIWARDNGNGGICLYKNGEGKLYAEKHVTSWHPIFVAKSKAEYSTIIRDWLENVAEEHPDEFSNDTSTSFDHNGKEKTSLDTTGPSDLDMLQLSMVC